MNKILFSMATMFGLFAMMGFLAVAPAQAPVETNDYGEGFDLEECEQECRSWFGIDPYGSVEPNFRGGGGYGPPGGYYAYASCIQDCNRKYWKLFEKETERLLK